MFFMLMFQTTFLPRSSVIMSTVYGTIPNAQKKTVAQPTQPKIVPPVLIQGGSLKTWSYRSPAVEQVEVLLSSNGRPLDCDVELWQGPQNTPMKMRVYSENGAMRPMRAILETPRSPNTIAVRNIGQVEFPAQAEVFSDHVTQVSQFCVNQLKSIQGGALRTYTFDPRVETVQVLLRTDGRPLNSRVELLQGPNNNKQVIELYTEDGMDRPFFAILSTPGAGNVIRIVNTAPIEFPLWASAVPNTHAKYDSREPYVGGDVDFAMW